MYISVLVLIINFFEEFESISAHTYKSLHLK